MTSQRIKEIFADAKKRPDRLTPWEVQFIDSLEHGMGFFGSRFQATAAQIEVLERLERKIYRVG